MRKHALPIGLLIVLLVIVGNVAHADEHSLRLAAAVDIPDVGEGQCVEPGPDGKPRPCAPQGRPGGITPRAPSAPSQPSVAAPRARRPCNQIPWENDQKRQCAQRVQSECKEKHQEGTEEFQQCVYRGLTGGGVEKQQKEKPKKKERKASVGKKQIEPKKRPTPPTTPSPRRSPGALEIPASTSPSTPSSRTRGGSESSPSPSPLPPPSSAPALEQCIFPFPPDCRGQCAGLPSYPTYEFEGCLTRCDQTYQAVTQEYNRCLERKGER